MLREESGCGLPAWVAAAAGESWSLMPSPQPVPGACVGPAAGAAAGSANSRVLKAC